MLSNAMVAFFLAIGSAGWIFAKTQKTSGNNTKSSLTVAGISGGLIFLLTLIVMSLIFKS